MYIKNILRLSVTVYGSTVFKAVKLTEEYPGTVSSDVVTRLCSTLPLSHVIPEGMIRQDEVCLCRQINKM